MSRKSQAFSGGQPAFSWKVEAIERDPYGKPQRYVCTCKNHPAIKGMGDTEQEAILAARQSMEAAVDNADIGMAGPTHSITPDGVKPV